MAIDFDALYKRAREKDEKARKSSGGAIVDPNHGKVAIPKPQPLPENTAGRASTGKFVGQALYTGLTSANKSLAQTADFLLPDQVTPQIIQKGIDYYKEVGEKNEEKLAAMSDTKTRQFTGQLLSGAVNMAPSALLAFASGGTSAAAQGAALAAEGGAALTTKAALTQAAKEAAKNPMFINSALQTLGPTYEKEKEAGASELQAGSAALANAILGSAVETSGGVETFKRGTGILKNVLRTAGEEGLEEAVQYSIENLSNKALGSGTAKWFSADETEDAVINPAAQAKAAATGAILGGLMGGGQAAVGKAAGKAAQTLPDAKKAETLPAAKSSEKNAAYTMSPEVQTRIFDAVQKRSGATIQYADLPEGIDGSYENGVITISNKAKNPAYTVLKHELTHHIERSGSYQELSSFIETSLRETGYDVDAELDNIIKSYAEIGQNLSPEQAKKEFVAKFSEEYLFNSEKSIERLARDNPNLFRRIYDWIVDTITKIGASQETKFLIDAQRKYEKALRTAGKSTYNGPTLNGKQYLYAGSKSLTADQNMLQEAMNMRTAGEPAEDIWQQTGWRYGKDLNWRYEINDKNAKAVGLAGKLENVLRHEELYAAYPQLRNYTVKLKQDMLDEAETNTAEKTIYLNENMTWDEESVKSAILHEAQHIIQDIEGFQAGSNPEHVLANLRKNVAGIMANENDPEFLRAKASGQEDAFIDNVLMKLYNTDTIQGVAIKAYSSLMGEAEARDVEARRNMSAEERRENFSNYEKGTTLLREFGSSGKNIKAKTAGSETSAAMGGQTGRNRTDGESQHAGLQNVREAGVADLIPDNRIPTQKAYLVEAGERPAFSMQKNEDSILMPDGSEFIFEQNKTEASQFGMAAQTRSEGPSTTSVNSRVAQNLGKVNSKLDSEGNNLTKQQQEYFADSKIRDEDGNLRVVYHGTEEEFTVFDRTKGRANMDIQGMFFSPWEDDAGGYGGDVKAYYLNIQNPAPESLGYKALRMFQGQNGAGIKAREYLEKLGYDGVNNGNEEYIAFYPEQIKLASNTEPTENEDIRFSEGSNLKRDAALYKASQTLYGEKSNKYLEYNAQSEAGEEPASFIATEPVRGEKKATSYQRRARKNAREAVKNILGVSKFADAKKIDAALDAAIEKMKTDSFTTADQDTLFDEMFSEGIVVNQQMVKDYANLKQTIRNTQLHVTEDVAKNITDFQTFRKDNLNNVRLSNDSGSEIDTFYDELQRDYPQLFPDLNTPAEMLEKISEVGKSIKETETRLQDMYDADFEAFYEESKAAFDREMEKLQDESTRVSRYLKDRNRKISVADAKARIEEIGRLRREADKVKAKTLLTDIDKTYVEMLHAGKMDESMVRSLTPLSADAIMQVYTAEKPLKEAQAALKETGSQARAEYRQLANQMLQGSENWKDKKTGLSYATETAERNMQDIAGSAGKKLAEAYFKPIHKAEAVSTRMKNDLRETVKDLNISIKDAYDVTDLMLDAPGLSEKIAEAKSKGKRLKISESTLLQLYGEGIISKEDIAHVGADAEKLDTAASVMRNIYNQLIDAANRELVRHGYEPIEYRQNYFPHFSEDKPDGVLANIADKLGFNVIKDELPTDIAGLTHTFKPGKKWFGNALQRTSRVTEYDAVKGFDIYLEGVADVIHQTENIQKLRQLESELRYRYSTEGVKAEIDEINADTELSEVQRQAKLDLVYEKSNTHLGKLAVWIRDYTDNLAGKKSYIDRPFENLLGRGLYNASRAVENKVAANMVAINPGSWLTNFIPLVQGSEVKNSNIIKGMAQTIDNYFRHDGIAEASTFVTNRRGSDVLWKSKTEVWQDRLTKPMEFIDSFVSESLVRARYIEELEKGKTPNQAMDIADEFAAGVIADRSKGALPTVFNAKNPLLKILTMYQVEVNNQWSHLFKDIPRTEENVMKVAWAYAKFAIGAYIFNDVYEYIVGRRPALDPLSWVNDFIGDLTGKQIQNFVEALFAAMNGEDLELEEKEKKGLAEASANLRENIYEDLPFVSGLMGGGRLPIQSAIPDVEAIMDAAATAREGGNRKKALSDIGGELLKPATYMVLPMGGGQLKKVGETALALYKGGNYALDSEGEKKLRFAVDPTVGNAIKGTLFGQYSLKNAQNYVESDFDMLSVKETKAYEELVESGMKNEEAEAFIRSLPSASKKTELRQALRDSDLTAEQKRAVGVALGDKVVNYSSDATFEYSLMTDEQKAYINKLTGAGASTADALEIYKLQGNYSSGVEKALALMQEDSYTAAICEALGISAATQEKAKALYDEGISMVNYNFAKRYADDNNNGSVSGEEAKAYLDRRTDMSRTEKFALYKALTGAKDKNNPYR